jgi:hypothetical protein
VAVLAALDAALPAGHSLARPVRTASVAGGSAPAATRTAATTARATAGRAAAATARAAADRASATTAGAAAGAQSVAGRAAGARTGRRERDGRRRRGRCNGRRRVTTPGHRARNLMGSLERHAAHRARDLTGEVGQRIPAELGQAHRGDRCVCGEDRDQQHREGADASRSSHRGRSLFAQIQCCHFLLALQLVIPASYDDRPTHPPEAGWLSAGRHAHA